MNVKVLDEKLDYMLKFNEKNIITCASSPEYALGFKQGYLEALTAVKQLLRFIEEIETNPTI